MNDTMKKKISEAQRRSNRTAVLVFGGVVLFMALLIVISRVTNERAGPIRRSTTSGTGGGTSYRSAPAAPAGYYNDAGAFRSCLREWRSSPGMCCREAIAVARHADSRQLEVRARYEVFRDARRVLESSCN